MLQISLQKAGKRFNKEWIFRDLDYTFEMGQHYALIGNNGSGKSTLLQTISGYATLSKGKIDWGNFNAENIFQQISLAAPYLELVEEFTTQEQFEFHERFKSLRKDLTISQIIEMIGLKTATHKQIRYFSSGMKQRLKLALAIFAESPILLLDEPCSNLDVHGIALYQRMIAEFAMEKLVLVSSNDAHEYEFCTQQIQISNYK